MVDGDALRQQLLVEQAPVEGDLVGGLELAQLLRHDRRDPVLLVGGGQVEAVHGAALQRLLAAATAEDEVDRRHHLLAVQLLDDVQHVVAAEVAVAREVPVGGVLLLGPVPGPAIDPALLVEHGVDAVVHRQPQAQLHRPLPHHHRAHPAAVGRHPVDHLLVVGDGGRQPHEADVVGRLDHDLLPDRAARVIVDVVDLVEDDVADVVEAVRVLVDQVAQDLGGHDHHRRLLVNGVLAGDQADVALAVLALEVAELLVAQRLQRRGVDGLHAGLERLEDGVVGNHRLAGRGRRRHQHAVVGAHLLDRLALEGVEFEGEGLLEGLEQAPGLGGQRHASNSAPVTRGRR